MSLDLSQKNPDIKSIAKKALKDKKLLSELLENLLSKKETLRFNSFNVLLLISEKHPKVLYPKWDFFVKLLGSDNAYHMYIAIYIIANLTRVDTKNKFEKIFNKYYSLLDDKRIVPPSHVAFNSGKIVKAKPKLQNKITSKLLNIDRIHHSAERKALIKSYVIEAFDQYFEETKDKKKIIEFVKKELKSKSPKTRKIATEFLDKWNA
jgi:hypothetical protein